MKVMIISCLEPQHLENCLKALKMWVPVEDIYVINNAFAEERLKQISAISCSYGVNFVRPEYANNQKNTKPLIHRIVNDFAKRFPDEIILKMDEDNILISDMEKFSFEKGVFFFPLSTINNYTSQIFLKNFFPELFDKVKTFTWMWHKPDPVELKEALFDAFYNYDPAEFIKFTEENSLREYITYRNYREKVLMEERGISTHAVAFHASDHIKYYGDSSYNQEKRFFELVKNGSMKYVIDHSIFCHHVNYHSVRELVVHKKNIVEKFHEGIFKYYSGMRVPSRKSRTRPHADVVVATGWYADSDGGKRGAAELAPQLFRPEYMSETFIPRIQKHLNPEAIHIYVSQCEVPPINIPADIEVVHGHRIARRNTVIGEPPYAIGAAHDWGAAMMCGAQFAYCNDLNMFFVEQDCLIHNFRRIWEALDSKTIVYGFGEKASYGPGWSEPSLLYVAREFLPEFISRMNKGMWHQWNKGFERFVHPEIQFHNTFADVSEYWGFGCGMKRPINYDDEIYFAQRFDEATFLEFLKRSPT